MTEPCQQQHAIGQLEATTVAISKTLDRLSDVLEKISAQGTKIDHLAEGQGLLFSRMRDNELSAQSEKVKVGFVMAGISAVTSLCIAIIVRYFKG
jgi:hypothetical protein